MSITARLTVLLICSGVGCGGTPFVVTEPSIRAAHRIPVTLGVLPARDVRPQSEVDGRAPRLRSMLVVFGYSQSTRAGARIAGDAALDLDDAPMAFGTRTLANVVGTHALSTVDGTGAFAQVRPIAHEAWTDAEIADIAARNGLQYVLTMEVRHFYVASFESITAWKSSRLEDRGGRRYWVTEVGAYGAASPVAESAVFRFSIHRVREGVASEIWRRDVASTVLADPSHGTPTGARAAAACLEQLADALRALAESQASVEPRPRAQPLAASARTAPPATSASSASTATTTAMIFQVE